MMIEKKWYAIYTRPHCERKVVEILAKRKVEYFCPVAAISRPQGKRKRLVLEPVFAGYIFVFISESEQASIKQIDNVTHFVYWRNAPAPIQPEEIDAMRFLADEPGRVVFGNIGVVAVPRLVVQEGPFLNWGSELSGAGERNVTAYLPNLGVKISAEFTMNRAEKVRFFHSPVIPLINADANSSQTITGS